MAKKKANVFTPGLKVSPETIVHKERRLPIPGEVLVEKGTKVASTDVVARTDLPGKVQMVNVANVLSLLPGEVPGAMLKKEGEKVAKGEVIAEKRTFFGLFRAIARAPMDGSIEAISRITGQVTVRGVPSPVEVQAYLDGEITDVFPSEGVMVRTKATFIQGIFGLAGERHGKLRLLAKSPEDVLTAADIPEDVKGQIVVGGSYADHEAFKRAMELGAHGLVVGGMDYRDIKAILGYEVGVAVTGNEPLASTLVLTEGFGRINMAQATFDLLSKSKDRVASINGATQIRAGVIRPEIVIPLEADETVEQAAAGEEVVGIDIGSLVRVIRVPNFGRLGRVVDLPPELTVLPTESKARVLTIEFVDDGRQFTLPRANVERIEER
ncbi:MAG: hypothetical protein ACOCVR_04835 [Myxococcota bacterium]